MATTTQGVKLDETLSQRLKELGKLKNRSPHYLMKAAIESYVEREEKYEAEKKEDAQRWERYQLTGEAIPHEVATEWLKSLAEGKTTPCPK